jgi:hypothetical protein
MSESASQSGGVARTHAVVALKLVLIDNFSGHHNPDLALNQVLEGNPAANEVARQEMTGQRLSALWRKQA